MTKFLTLAAILGLSMVSHAQTAAVNYFCNGYSSSGDRFTVRSIEVKETPQELGKLDGRVVTLEAKGDKIYLIQQFGNKRIQSRASSGSLVEYSEDGDSLLSVSCLPLN